MKCNISFRSAASPIVMRSELALIQLGIDAAKNGLNAEQVVIRSDRHKLAVRANALCESLVAFWLGPYRVDGSCTVGGAIVLDAVSVNGIGYLVSSFANALVSQETGASPFPLHIIRCFRGNCDGYTAAGR
jgi:hypothetical protein